MLDLFKYLRGYLQIRVKGFSPERFINLCSSRDILLWDIRKEKEEYIMCISLKSFFKIRPIAKKTGTRVVILKRCGLPFFFPLLCTRKFFVAGFLLAVCFWYVSSLFIWDIRIEGNYRVTTDQFEEFLDANQVRVGMRKANLDIGQLEKEIRKKFTEVTWTSARLDGTKLFVSVKENDAPILEAVPDETEEGLDIVAEFDGTIVSIVVRNGVPLVRRGEFVEQGTVLVEGKIPVYNEDTTVKEYQFTDSDADILLEHVREYQTNLPFDYIRKEYTGRTKTRHFLLYGELREWKLPIDAPFLVYDSVRKTEQPVLFEKLHIPVFFGTDTYREYQNVEHEYTLEEAKSLLNENLMRFLTSLEEKGVQIIEKNVKIDTSGGEWLLNGEFVVQEPMEKKTATDRGEQGVHDG